MRIVLDNDAYMPLRAHKDDAGLDLRTPVDFTVEPGKSAIINTGVHIDIPHGYVGMLKSKSGLNVKKGIVGEGVVDAGYTGSIIVKLYNNGELPVTFFAGDKIIQLVIIPVVIDEIEIVQALECTKRGSNGFGSSGR